MRDYRETFYLVDYTQMGLSPLRKSAIDIDINMRHKRAASISVLYFNNKKRIALYWIKETYATG